MKPQTTIDYSLSLNDTSLIKGVAICFMLWHHLFYKYPEYGCFVYYSSQIAKICVSLFLFLSAYGLTIQFSKISYKSPMSVLKFQAIRLMKFYANYWVVFIVVVPIGVFVLGRTLEEAYSTNNVLIPFFIDILGVSYLKSYNITWWFNTLIICCYLIFPILFFAIKRWSVFVLGIILLFHLIPISVEWPLLFLFKMYILIFSIGVAYGLNNIYISRILNKINPFVLVLLLFIVLITLTVLRLKYLIPYFGGMNVDPFLTLVVVLMSMAILRHVPYLNIGMSYLGKHSMNIYMVHSFIYYYYYSDFIYSFKSPILIFIVLLILSLSISIILEYLKKRIHFEELVKHISSMMR